MREAGNRRAPQNGFARLAVPTVGQVLFFGYACGLQPTKRRPVSIRIARFSGFGRAGATCVGCAGDTARGDDFSLFGRRPDAVVQNHPARHAIIRDEIERDMLAFEPQPISPRAFATFWRFGRDQFKLISRALPIAAQCGPACALQLECAISIEPRGEGAELQWGGRKLYISLLTRVRWS